MTFTRAELLTAGAGPDEDIPENYGHLFQEFHHGIWGGSDAGGIVGTYRLDGNKIFLTLTTTDEAGTTFSGTWAFVGDTLKLGGGIPTPMRVKPYTRVAAPVSVLDGRWEVDTTHAELLAVPGLQAGEDGPNNYGHFELDLHRGVYRLIGPDGSTVKGIFTVDGNMLFETVTAGEDTGLTWNYTWALAGGLLTFGGDVPAPVRAKPWTKVGP